MYEAIVEEGLVVPPDASCVAVGKLHSMQGALRRYAGTMRCYLILFSWALCKDSSWTLNDLLPAFAVDVQICRSTHLLSSSDIALHVRLNVAIRCLHDLHIGCLLVPVVEHAKQRQHHPAAAQECSEQSGV